MCLADLYDLSASERAALFTASPTSEQVQSCPLLAGEATLSTPARRFPGNPLPAPAGVGVDSTLRDRREGRVLALRGGARILAEAMEAPDNRIRAARWRNRYATIPLEYTTGASA